MTEWEYRKRRFRIMLRNWVFTLLSLLGVIPALLAWSPQTFTAIAKMTVAFEKRVFALLADMVLDEDQKRYFRMLSWAKDRFEQAAEAGLLILPPGKRDFALAFAYFSAQWKVFVAMAVVAMILLWVGGWRAYRRDVRQEARSRAMLEAAKKPPKLPPAPQLKPPHDDS